MVRNFASSLIESVMKREYILFIGAGVSIEAGLPSGSELAQHLYNDLKANNYQRPDNFTLPRIAEDYVMEFSRKKLEEKLHDYISYKMKDCNSETYELIAKLQPLPIVMITTNYDRLLENALDPSEYVPIFNDKALSKYTISKTNLFKIHGDINSLEDAVITETDIRNFKKTHKSLWVKLKSLFQQWPVIFLGFSVEDLHIRDLYAETKKEMQEHFPEAYAITPSDNSVLRFREIGVQHINMTAKEFILMLLKELNEKGYKTVPFNVGHSNNNPFAVYSTENFPSCNWEEMLNKTFIPPIDFSQIVEKGNTIIEGHRGSGKTMILKYMSYEAQSERKFAEDWDKDYIGFYIKTRASIVNTTTKEFFRGNKEEWVMYFTTYMNLLIGEEIITTLIHASERKDISIDEGHFVRQLVFCFFEDVFPESFDKNLKNLQLTFLKKRTDLTQNHKTGWYLPPDFLEQLFKLIIAAVPEWKNKSFYLLIDEYDNLDYDQQAVVNTLIRDRFFSFKIGVKLLGMNYKCVDNKTLELNHDYILVNTDRYDLAGKDYKRKYEKFAEKVINKRLESYGYNNTADKLFPKNEKRGGFENNDYSGFKNIVRLSSNIIRDLLELCKDMVYYSNPWVLHEKREQLDVVSPNIQNTVIKIHSNILYENISQVIGIDENTKKPRAENLRTLIDSLAKIFKYMLKGSKSKELRTVSSFQIKNIDKLNPTTKNALMDGVEYRLLQIALIPRAPKDAVKYTPFRRFSFHRLLCPRYELSLANRWPPEISASILNAIFVDPRKAIKQIANYFIKNIPSENDITKYLAGGGNEKKSNNAL